VAGRKVQPCVALESDIRHALARHLGLPLPPRFQALGAPQPTPAPHTGTGPAPSSESLRAVAPGWGQSTPAPGNVPLRPLRLAESSTPASGLGQRDWVARALETLRTARSPADFEAVLAHLAVPGMSHVVFLRVVADGLTGVAAAADGLPVPGVAALRVRPEPDSIIGRAVDRGATRCGAFREDVAFRQLYDGLALPAPGDVLVVPLKRGERVQGVFVGDNGPQTIAPLTASAVRRLLAGLVEIWPEPEGEIVTREAGLSPLDPDGATPQTNPPPATQGALAATFPVFRALRRPTAELVSLPPQATPPMEPDLPSGALESESGLPEWELPDEPTVPVGAGRPSSPAEARQEAGDAAPVDLFTSADVAELALLDESPNLEPTTETRPGVPVLSTRPLLTAVSSAAPATGAIADTLVEMRPMALAELVDALTAEARPTQTLAAVSALKESGPAQPRPQLLDLDDMATVPAMERLRPRTPADAPPPPPPAPAPAPAPAVPMSVPLPEPEPVRSLPFPTPGWTDEIPVPVVTAIRRGLVDVEPQTEVEAPAVRFRAIGAGPSLQSDGPKPASAAPSLAPTPFDPPSGPMPRVTVTLTPRPVDPESDPLEREPELAPAAPPSAPAAPLPVSMPRRTTDADLEAALEALGRPDAAARQQAEDLLLSVGEPALASIFRAFPGHLVVDRFAQPAGAVAVEQHSALLRVVVRLGPLAAKPLEALCSHLSPEIRYYAVYAFSTLRSQASLPVVAARLADSDASVRDIAVHVLEQYRGQSAFKEVVAELREALRTAPPRRRRPVIEAAGRLHLAEAIPELVAHLGDLSSGLHEPAHRALQEIARADFGLDAWKWQKWHERNGHRPRVEWLLDGLLSDTRAIRAGAFQELRRLTHQNYGYLVDAPPAERRSGHERWLKWWRDVGMTRFAGYR
jgi:hypothetical protein